MFLITTVIKNIPFVIYYVLSWETTLYGPSTDYTAQFTFIKTWNREYINVKLLRNVSSNSPQSLEIGETQRGVSTHI